MDDGDNTEWKSKTEVNVCQKFQMDNVKGNKGEKKKKQTSIVFVSQVLVHGKSYLNTQDSVSIDCILISIFDHYNNELVKNHVNYYAPNASSAQWTVNTQYCYYGLAHIAFKLWFWQASQHGHLDIVKQP